MPRTLPPIEPANAVDNDMETVAVTPPPRVTDGPRTNSPYREGAIVAGRYRLLRPLGRGGMGEVWSAHHLVLNTTVAVKFLSSGASGYAQRLALERFRFEAQVSAQLGQRSKHVVGVHDAGIDEAGPYVVMDFVDGRTLRAVLNERGPLAPRFVAKIVEQVASALGVAHAAGIVHRDLKPSNLLLATRPDGSFHVKVADFGIAKALRKGLAVDRPEDTADGFLLGSPAHMSPEQLDGGPIDSRADLWALGVIAYEALTGRLPFRAKSVPGLIVNVAKGDFEAPSRLRSSLPRGIDAWCARSLARQPGRRFATAPEMARAFDRAIEPHAARVVPRSARVVVGGAWFAAATVMLDAAPDPAIGARPAEAACCAAPVVAAVEERVSGAPAKEAARAIEATATPAPERAEVPAQAREAPVPAAARAPVASTRPFVEVF